MAENDELAARLWNEDVPDTYGDSAKYRDHLLEQYKLYIEMADRISARRVTANTFFLTINTALVAAMAAYFEKVSAWCAVFMSAAAVVLCYVWGRLIVSYRQLNTAKFEVIGEMEKRLPCSPWWSAEWKALGEGEDPKIYKRLTGVERWVPRIFAGLYILLFATIMVKRALDRYGPDSI